MDGPALTDAYSMLKSGSLWSSNGKCKGYAVANPGEAAQIDAYVAALAAGQHPVTPVLQTATGKGVVAMLAAMARVPFTVSVSGKAQSGQRLTAVVT